MIELTKEYKEILVNELNAFAKLNKEQKVDIRSKTMADCTEWSDLRWSQFQTTVLCTLRAFTRGRIHRHNSTLELEERFLNENRRTWEGLIENKLPKAG